MKPKYHLQMKCRLQVYLRVSKTLTCDYLWDINQLFTDIYNTRGAFLVKNLPAVQETLVQSLG